MNRCLWWLINGLKIEYHGKEWEFRSMKIKISFSISFWRSYSAASGGTRLKNEIYSAPALMF